MGPARFGTDGVRGVANEELTAELALALGRAAARILPAPTFVVGRDTRRSGPLLQAAFSAGLATEGADVVDLGVLPTPGVAAVAEARKVPGAVISASHNPFGDNGIKLFSLRGTKLPPDVEAEIERELDSILADPDTRPAGRPATGWGRSRPSPRPRSSTWRTWSPRRKAAGSRAARRHRLRPRGGQRGRAAVLEELGASVVALHDSPDGVNINEKCGSTDPSELSLAVVERGADLGLAFDGDADRVIAVDHTGTIVDGDVLLALFALDLAERGRLAANTVAVTVMTNLGFRLAMEARGIAVRETDVGDRHVLAALDADGLSLGGEQSGHIIFRSLSTTGDGILTGIALADLVLRAGRSLADLSAGLVERVPQRLVNVPIPQPERLAGCAEVWEAVVKAEAELGHEGRVLLRPSGTEPVVRVMVEARDEAQANAVAAAARRGRGGRPGANRAAGTQVAWVPMCGIIGVTGEADAVPLLIGALHQLEYRGYDSAGIAIVVDDDGRATPSGGSGPPAAPTRWPSWPSWRPTPPGATGPPSGTPGGPPTAARPWRTPTRTPTAPGGWPSSTTASSRTTPSSGPSSWPPGTSSPRPPTPR